jgi:hypothetical protein
MKWAGRLMTSLATVLLTAGGAMSGASAAITTVDSAWSEAVKSNTLEAYAAFLMAYPNSEFASSAYDRLSSGATASNEAPAVAGASRSGDASIAVGKPEFVQRTLMIV